MRIAAEKDQDGLVQKTLLDCVVAFNQEAAGVQPGKKLVIAVRDEDGAIQGGVYGHVNADSAYFDLVYLSQPLRGSGMGRNLMQAAEMEALKLGAHNAWLYTMSWQARPFYEMLGYECIGEMPFLGGQHRRYFMWKKLCA